MSRSRRSSVWGVRRWLEHTGEAALELRADDEEGVFAEALAGLAELLGEPGPDAPLEERELAVRAPDRPALLVAWLEELLWISERDGVVPVGVVRLGLGPDGLRATVAVAPGPPRPLVKAVTWHDLCFAPAGAGYRARVVLDV